MRAYFYRIEFFFGGLAAGLFFLAIYPLWGKEIPRAPSQGKQNSLKKQTEGWVLENNLLFQKGGLGTITSIAPLFVHPDSQPGFVVTGQNGAAYLSGDGTPRSTIQFERQGYHMVPVRVEADKQWVFMNRGGDRQQVHLFDSAGLERWRYGLGLEPIPYEMDGGDLDGDGRPEFAVGVGGEYGLRLLDLDGAEKWRQPESNPWNVEILDLDQDGKFEIVHTNSDGRVCIRDANGELIRELTYNTFVIYFSLCRWPTTQGDWVLINNSRLEGIQLLDFSGKVVITFSPPVKGMQVFATPVQLSAVEKPYFALLVCNCLPRHDSRLFLYNANGEIMVEKSFPTRQATLLAVPDHKGDTEKLLIGESEGKIWQYQLKSTGSSDPN
jgi:hypothetical protein